MILKEALEASLIIFLFKTLIEFYFYVEKKIATACHRSYSHSAINYFVNIIEEEDVPFLQNSKVGYWVINLYKKLQRETADYLGVSSIKKYTVAIKEEFNSYPFKTVGVLLISAIFINLVLFYLFQAKLSSSGLIIRVILLAIGFLCLFCDTDWAAVKKGSALLKILSR